MTNSRQAKRDAKEAKREENRNVLLAADKLLHSQPDPTRLMNHEPNEDELAILTKHKLEPTPRALELLKYALLYLAING
jgi:hypothetical protein